LEKTDMKKEYVDLIEKKKEEYQNKNKELNDKAIEKAK